MHLTTSRQRWPRSESTRCSEICIWQDHTYTGVNFHLCAFHKRERVCKRQAFNFRCLYRPDESWWHAALFFGDTKDRWLLRTLSDHSRWWCWMRAGAIKPMQPCASLVSVSPSVNQSIYTVSQKNQRYYSFITLANVGRFKKKFLQISCRIKDEQILKICQHLGSKQFVKLPQKITRYILWS